MRDEDSSTGWKIEVDLPRAGRRCRTGEVHRGGTSEKQNPATALNSTRMGILARDTECAAERAQFAILKSLPTRKKLELLDSACTTTRALVMAGLRSRFPRLSHAELHRMLMDVTLGRETAERIWGPPAPSSR